MTSNYNAYKFRISRILKEKKLLSIVDGSEPKPVTVAGPATTESATTTATTGDAVSKWEERDEKAFTLISVTIKDDQIGYIQTCTTSKEAWDKLAAVHQGIGSAGRMILRQRIINLRLEEGCSEEGLRQQLGIYRSLSSKWNHSAK